MAHATFEGRVCLRFEACSSNGRYSFAQLSHWNYNTSLDTTRPRKNVQKGSSRFDHVNSVLAILCTLCIPLSATIPENVPKSENVVAAPPPPLLKLLNVRSVIVED